MTYISWAAFHEGPTDRLYFEVLLPRVLQDIISNHGIRQVDIPTSPAVILGQDSRSVEHVAAEICENRDAFELLFIHADTGGRGLQGTLPSRSIAYCQKAFELCAWPAHRCITVTPKHETEAWILADPLAVTDALGYKGDASELGLPLNASEAERLRDPKAVLSDAIRQVSGKRRKSGVDQLFATIAQRQAMSALRTSQSFCAFEQRLRFSLGNLRLIRT